MTTTDQEMDDMTDDPCAEFHGEIGLVPPAEFETHHWASQPTKHYRQNPVLTEVESN